MMKIRNILYIATALLLAGCANEELTTANNGTLSGEGKTPLRIEASLSTDAVRTRAVDKQFEANDELLTYIRHITGDTKGSYTSISADQAPKLVTLKVNGAATDQTSNFVVPIYWDDFSDSTPQTDPNPSKDLRTSGHGLQSYYGYCYNGGTPSTALVPATGVLGWTVQTNQSATAKTSDLLWSPEQAKVEYAHSTAREGTSINHGTMTIPYTHAMSEITVTINAVEGFTGNPLTNTSLKLYGMKTTATLTAPTGAIDKTDATTADITMFGNAYTSDLTRTFTAIVAPGTKLKVGEKLLDITNVDGNNYTLTITGSMLSETEWGANTDTNDNSVTVESGTEGSNKYILTQSGVNYHLTVTVNKTKVQTKATLAEWKTVNATGTGDIDFKDNDTDLEMLDDSDYGITGKTGVKVVAVDKNFFSNGASFSLFTLKSTDNNTGEGKGSSTRPNDTGTYTGYDFVTKSTFQDNAGDANDQWNNSPEIYWDNREDKFYFRALAQFNSCTNGVNNIESVGTDNATPPNRNKGTAVAVSQGTINEGHDILWGTTAKHIGKTKNITYEHGQAIPPRTGGVPIAFDHALSKVTFIIETTGAADDTENNTYEQTSNNTPKVDLRNVKIDISNLYTSGTITIDNGDVSPAASKTAEAISGTATAANTVKQITVIDNLIVIPQTIANESVVTISLKDQSNNVVAIYKLQLNQCTMSTGGTPNKWERGKHYTYTIHIEKDKIDFRALVKDWEVVTGSGNANLEWD